MRNKLAIVLKIVLLIIIIMPIVTCSRYIYLFFQPCKIIIEIVNNDQEPSYLLTLYNGNEYYLNHGERIVNDISEQNINIGVYIKTNNYEKVITLGEYDHWFAVKHNVKIIIDDEISIDGDRMAVRVFNGSLDEY
jgi:hypothetical protein